MQAKTKVIAGSILVMVTAKVAVVYFIPKKYKFWSITGLPQTKKLKLLSHVSIKKEELNVFSNEGK